jgi:hypothetical protein
MKFSTSKGFQAKLPNKSDATLIKKRFKSIASRWRTSKLQVIYAYVNALIYRACRISGIIKQTKKARGSQKGFHKIIGDIRDVALKGIDKFNITIEGLVDQIANFWGLSISEASLRKYRYELRNSFELFQFESQPFPVGRKGDSNNRRPPALEGFDLVLSCIFLEALEEILVEERNCNIEDFPGCGAMSRVIYNALFKGIASYRRKNAVPDVAVIYHNGRSHTVSQIDWNDNKLTDRGLANWLGITLIPNEEGIVPEPL